MVERFFTKEVVLIFVPGEKKDKLTAALQREGILAARIGDVTGGEIKDNIRMIVEK